MSVPLSGKRKDDGLRPLSEKEIQEKLYGEFHKVIAAGEDDLAVEVTEKPAFAFSGPGGKPAQPPKISPPRPVLQRRSLPRVKISLPWRQVYSVFLTAFGALGNLLKAVLGKLGTGWGVGTVIVVAIFVAVHLLNAYRTTAMKTAKPRPTRAVSRALPKALPLVSPPLDEESVVRPVTLNETPLRPAGPAPAAFPVTPAPEARPARAGFPSKLFTLQVATYARSEDAVNLAQKLEQEGWEAFSLPSPRSNGKVFHPVYVGRFANFQEAQAKLKEFKARPVSREFPDSFIRSLSNS